MDLMTKKFVQRNIKLSLEFDNYLAKHPELYEAIPDGAFVIIAVKSDKEFTNSSIAIAKKHHTSEPVVKAEKEGSHWHLTPVEFSPAH